MALLVAEVFPPRGDSLLGYVIGTMKAVPLAFIKPVRGATDGLSRVILGVKNQVDQSEKKLMDDKYGTNKRGTNEHSTITY